jgi:pimeloyl-ACP methyl ester carboxylesterase
MRSSRPVRLAALAAVLLAAHAGAQTRPALGPCDQQNLPGTARCATVSVPENRQQPDGRQIALNVVVIPSTSATPVRNAITFFGGGPGQAATVFAGWMNTKLASLRGTHDLLFIDQRGTGGSGPLVCNLRDRGNPQSYVDDFLPAARAAACRDSLAAFADLTRYGFPELAHDTEAVRRAFGYDQLDLWGGSYGTRAAQVYLRMYPDRVRSMVLQGVTPPSFLQPRNYARDTDAAMAGVLGDCRAEPACSAAFPHAAEELRAVTARLETTRGEGEIMDPASGRRVRLTISRGDFAETLRRMMYNPGSAGLLPVTIHRAFEGDFRPVLRQALADRRGSAGSMYQGLYLAITCSEDVPGIDRTVAARDNGRTLLGDWRVRQQADACAGWPTFTPPAGYYEPVRSGVPALLISGQWDPVTPASGGDEVMRDLSNAVHVIVPHAGHGYEGMPGSACVDSMMIHVFREASVRGLDAAGCAARVRREPFVTVLPEAVAVVPAVLERLAGTYTSTQPAYTIQFEALDGALRARARNMEIVASPLSPTRFFWEGQPAGYEFEFSADGRSVTLRAPGEQFVLTRQP